MEGARLHPAVQHRQARPAAGRPFEIKVSLARGDLAHQVAARHPGGGLHPGQEGVPLHRAGGDPAAHGAPLADAAGEGAGVHPLDPRHRLGGQAVGQAGDDLVVQRARVDARAAPRRIGGIEGRTRLAGGITAVAGVGARTGGGRRKRFPPVLAHHEAGRVHARGLPLAAADAVGPDHRIGHQDDLPGVGGVGDHLLVAGQPGVEDQLPEDLPRSGEAPTFAGGPVLEHQQGIHLSAETVLRGSAFVKVGRGGTGPAGRGPLRSGFDYIYRGIRGMAGQGGSRCTVGGGAGTVAGAGWG